MTAVRRDWVVLVAAVLLQLVVLYAPSGAGPSTVNADKLVHFAIFALVAWAGRRVGLPLVPLVVVLVAHAVLSEVVQATLLDERSGDPWDVVADVVGIGVGVLLPTRRAREIMAR